MYWHEKLFWAGLLTLALVLVFGSVIQRLGNG
jgi:hypothetical protein